MRVTVLCGGPAESSNMGTQKARSRNGEMNAKGGDGGWPLWV